MPQVINHYFLPVFSRNNPHTIYSDKNSLRETEPAISITIAELKDVAIAVWIQPFVRNKNMKETGGAIIFISFERMTPELRICPPQ